LKPARPNRTSKRRWTKPWPTCWPGNKSWLAIALAYLAALGEFNDQLEGICQRNRIERVLVDTSRDLGEVLVDYLNQRSRLNRGR